jgi:hypothetical protein
VDVELPEGQGFQKVSGFEAGCLLERLDAFGDPEGFMTVPKADPGRFEKAVDGSLLKFLLKIVRTQAGGESSVVFESEDSSAPDRFADPFPIFERALVLVFRPEQNRKVDPVQDRSGEAREIGSGSTRRTPTGPAGSRNQSAHFGGQAATGAEIASRHQLEIAGDIE